MRRMSHICRVIATALLCGMVALALASDLQAGDSVSVERTGLTLSQALARLETVSPALLASRDRALALDKRASRDGGWENPMFMYERMLDRGHVSSYDVTREISVTQALPLFRPNAARGDMTRADRDAQKARAEETRLRLRAELAGLYYEYRFLEAERMALSVHRETLAMEAKVAGVEQSVGALSRADALSAQLELAGTENELLTLADEKRATLAAINGLITREAEASIDITDTTDTASIRGGLVFSDSVIVRYALEHSPRLRLAGAMIAGARANERMALREYFPMLSVTARHMKTESVLHQGGPPEEGSKWMGGVGVSVPLWAWQNISAKRSAAAFVSAERYDSLAMARELVTETRMALTKTHEADRRRRLAREIRLPLSADALAATEALYAGGTARFGELLSAQRLLFTAKRELARAEADFSIAVANLEALVGAPLTDGALENGESQ